MLFYISLGMTFKGGKLLAIVNHLNLSLSGCFILIGIGFNLQKNLKFWASPLLFKVLLPNFGSM